MGHVEYFKRTKRKAGSFLELVKSYVAGEEPDLGDVKVIEVPSTPR